MRKTPSSYSPGHTSGMISPDSKETGSPRKVVASEDNVQSGFSVGGPREVDGESLGQQSTLTDETPQSQLDIRDSSIGKIVGSSLLVNGFDEAPESLEALSNNPFAKSDPSSPPKNSTEESQKQSETAADDLSPWKKPKPVSLAVPPPPPPAKTSSNPFDGLDDDHVHVQEPAGVSSTAQVSSANDGMGNGINQLERRSHDQGPTSASGAATVGRNPFDDDITGKNPFDDNQFEYGYEEPKSTVEIPGTFTCMYNVGCVCV